MLNFLPGIISGQQNGFVPSQQILDSIISVHENLHSLVISKKEGFLLKLDLSKAYDRVDWDFLLCVLEAYSFNKIFLDLVHMLVSSATFLVLINGSPSPFFHASRGLRQGDPLSPILFVIMAECLGRFIHNLVLKGEFVGLKPSSHD
jgi:hypothetical protein